MPDLRKSGQADSAPQGSTAEWLTDRVFRAALAGALAIPYERRVPFMGALLRRVIGPAAGYRRRILDQLQMIWPELPQQDRVAIAGQVLDNFGRTLIETYSGDAFSARMAKNPMGGPGLDAIAEAKAKGRAVLFLTGHFGNHEASRHALVAQGYQIGGLYRPMANPYTNAHYARTLTRLSGPVLPQSRRGVAQFARHLGSGGMATLLFDVWTREGQPIPFLGAPALTALSAAELALRFDALLVPYFATRRDDGLSFDIEVEAPIPHSAPLEMMTTATARLEARVRQDPGQWFWVHKRWKPERLAKYQSNRAVARTGPKP